MPKLGAINWTGKLSTFWTLALGYRLLTVPSGFEPAVGEHRHLSQGVLTCVGGINIPATGVLVQRAETALWYFTATSLLERMREII